MAAILKVWCHIENPLSMSICLKTIPAKFHPYPIWNDGALGLFEKVAQQQQEEQQQDE